MTSAQMDGQARGKQRRRWWVLAASALLLVLQACTAPGDMLQLGVDEFTLCVPAPGGSEGDVVFGDVTLRHVGGDAITITGVDLVKPIDLELIAADLVEVGPEEGVVGLRYTTDLEGMPAGWEGRISAVGALLTPDDEYNLALTVESHASDVASAQAAKISYETTAGTDEWQVTKTKMLVSHRSCEEVLAEQ